jgi:hypothetical protein
MLAEVRRRWMGVSTFRNLARRPFYLYLGGCVCVCVSIYQHRAGRGCLILAEARWTRVTVPVSELPALSLRLRLTESRPYIFIADSYLLFPLGISVESLVAWMKVTGLTLAEARWTRVTVPVSVLPALSLRLRLTTESRSYCVPVGGQLNVMAQLVRLVVVLSARVVEKEEHSPE